MLRVLFAAYKWRRKINPKITLLPVIQYTWQILSETIMRLNLCITVFLIGTISGWRNHSGIRLNIKPTQASSAYGNRGRSSIQIGKGFGLKDMTTTVMSTTVEEVSATTYVIKPQIRNHRNAFNLTIGIVVPFKTFGTREYTKALTNAINSLKKKDHEKQFKMNFRIDMLNLTPSPIRKWWFFEFLYLRLGCHFLSFLCKPEDESAPSKKCILWH